MRNNVFQFEPDKPAIIALKYRTGKPCSTGNYTYTLANGLVCFFPEDVNKEIQALHLDPGQPIQVTKRSNNGKGFSWQVERVPGAPIELQEKRPAAGGVPSNCQLDNITPPILTTNHGRHILQQLIGAVDIAHAAEVYSEKMGRPVKFDAADIRALAISCFIQQSREM